MQPRTPVIDPIGPRRLLGVDIAKAALAAGRNVVATGRNAEKVAEVLGKPVNLLIGKLDITKPSDAESAIKALKQLWTSLAA